MSLADLLPLMTDTVRHLDPSGYDIFGKPQPATTGTDHPARVVRSIGTEAAAADPGIKVGLAKATVWLINHPRPIALRDQFEITPGAPLEVIAVEERPLEGGQTLTKVYLA